ncbi:MAG: hypothetical protein HFG16_02030 [Erysipelotrichaceae bacterium]|nr:hypothetical protein [Erysipelotrichaceae bacterium]
MAKMEHNKITKKMKYSACLALVALCSTQLIKADEEEILYLHSETDDHEDISTSPAELLKNEWKTEDGVVYYYDEFGNKIKDASYIVNDKMYLFDIDGVASLYTGWYETEDRDKLYYENGTMVVESWKDIEGHTYYFDEDGKMVKQKTIMLDGFYYTFNEEGHLKDSQEIKTENNAVQIQPIEEHYYNQWVVKDGKIYYYDINGNMIKNNYHVVNGRMYLFDADGVAALYTGWQNKNGMRIYYENGYLAMNEWKMIDGRRYYFDKNGYLLKEQWLNLPDGKYYLNSYGMAYIGKMYVNGLTLYFDEDGRQAINEWETFDGRRYYFDKNGYLLKEQWLSLPDGKYYLNSYGMAYIGKMYVNGLTLYFDEDGRQAINEWKTFDGRRYYFDKNGYLLKEQWLSLPDGKYYLNSYGMAYIGKMYVNGLTLYFDEDGRQAINEWKTLDGRRYYFDKNGYLLKEQWLYLPDGEYYLNSYGMAYVGFMKTSSYTLYFDELGRKCTGWRTIDGERYYFDVNGHMAYAFTTINGIKYCLDGNGNKLTGWQKINGEKYYFNALGQMVGNRPAKKVIDVSEWQGVIDWNRVIKEGGVDFVILRTSGKGCDLNDPDSRIDQYLVRNARALEALHIPYAIYYYAYAANLTEARDEANYNLMLINKYNLHPHEVYYDMEDAKYQGYLSSSTLVGIAKTFCDIIQSNGYTAGIYANLNWWNNKLNDPVLNQYARWIAQWNNNIHEPDYSGAYRMWQYTSSGSVPGITGRVDISIRF